MLARTFRFTIYMVTLRKENNVAEKIINEALELVQSRVTNKLLSYGSGIPVMTMNKQ